MKARLFALALGCCLCGCEATRLSGGHNGSSTEGLAAVSGTWKFSHFGPPTISHPDVPDPAGAAKEHLEGTILSISGKGAGSMIAAGQARSFTAKIIEESALYTKIGIDDQHPEKAFVFDKSTRLLMMPTQLAIEGEQGILPTYFKRQR